MQRRTEKNRREGGRKRAEMVAREREERRKRNAQMGEEQAGGEARE